MELSPMENVWTLAALWVGLALVATLLAIWFKISTALSEIVVGTVAQLVIGAFYTRPPQTPDARPNTIHSQNQRLLKNSPEQFQ